MHVIKLAIVDSNHDYRFRVQVSKAIDMINGSQRYYYIEQDNKISGIMPKGTIIRWDKIRGQIQKGLSALSNKPEYQNIGYFVFVTKKSFSDNFFSREEDNFSIISVSDWEENFSPPPAEVYIAYQIAQALLNYSGNLTEKMTEDFYHSVSKGCVFDLCETKEEIKLGMVAGRICHDCLGRLRGFGVDHGDIEAVEAILARIRLHAIGKASRENIRQAFVVMKFTKDDENDRAYKRGIIPGLKKAGIEPIRADQMNGRIFESVENGILQSRFVIVKPNFLSPNVYLELGMAVSLIKEILIIVESSESNEIPTDLRDWRYLSYTKGNYKELAANISKWFCTWYHLCGKK